MSKLAIIGIAGTIGISAFAFHQIQKAKGDSGNGNGEKCVEFNDDKVNLNNPPIVIDTLEIVKPSGHPLAFRFDASYRSRSCKTETFEIIMDVQVFDPEFGKYFPDRLESRTITLEPGQAQGFQWNIIFLDDNDRKVEFLVWRSLSNPIALAKSKTINVT